MVKSFESIKIASGNATKLADFYKKKLGLKQTWDAVMGEDINVYGFTIKGIDLVILDNPKTKGKSKEGSRVVVSLEVDNIEKEFARLKRGGVKVITSIYHIEEYGYVAVFADPDGNHFQIAKTRE